MEFRSAEESCFFFRANQHMLAQDCAFQVPPMALLAPATKGRMSEQTHGLQNYIHYGEPDPNTVLFYQGYRIPSNEPYNSCINNQHHLTNFPIAQNTRANLPMKGDQEAILSSIRVPLNALPQVQSSGQIMYYAPHKRMLIHFPRDQEASLSSIWVPLNALPQVQSSGQIMYYAPHKRMVIHFPRVPRDGDIFFSKRIDNELFLSNVSRQAPWKNHGLHSSGYSVDKGFYRVHGTKSGFGFLLSKTGDDVLASRVKNITFTSYFPHYDIALHFTTYPNDGDIFYSQQNDNVITLYNVPPENTPEYHILNCSPYPRIMGLYRVKEKNNRVCLRRMGDEIFVFHEENKTATYYLPEKDFVLHFTKVPRDGDIFYSQHNNNVLVLDTLPAQTSQGHSFIYPWDKDLYRVYEQNGGFLLGKIDNNYIPSEEYYFFGESFLDEENSTFTCYLNYMNLAFHFNRVPTHGDIFRSRLKNNIMILEVCPIDGEQHPNCAYGSPFDVDYYCVQQIDAGFELVKIISRELSITAEYQYRLRLKIRRYIASIPSSAEEDNECAVCLAAYNNFDRIGRLSCGHEYHVSCIMAWLPKKNLCPLCRCKGVINQVPRYSCLASAPPTPSLNLVNLSI